MELCLEKNGTFLFFEACKPFVINVNGSKIPGLHSKAGDGNKPN